MKYKGHGYFTYTAQDVAELRRVRDDEGGDGTSTRERMEKD